MGLTPATARRPAARLGCERLEDRTTPATLPTGFTEAVVADGLSNATAMEVSPAGDLWVLEQGGGLKRFRPGSATADVVANISTLGIRSEGERGLLGIAFSPTYATDKQVYLYYTKANGTGPHNNRISRFTVNDSNPADNSLVDTTGNPAVYDETVILNLDPLSGATNHNGGAIHFGPDGKLYAAVGDNAAGANAQSLSNRHGKILRLNPDGSVPADNPTSVAGIAGTTSGANRAIWAAGLRNPYTFAFQPGTGRMFVNDVGQGTWEEVNEGGAGRNFGWPTTEGDFSQASYPNFTRPVYAYSHGGGTFQGYAITGGAFYNPATSQFPGEYSGDYFFADYVNSWVNVVNADGSDPRRFATNAPATVDLRVTADGGLLYLARGSGKAFKVTYTASQAPAITQQPQNATVSAGANATFTVAASGTGLAYRWQKLVGSTWTDLADGADYSGTGTATLTVLAAASGDAGQYRAVVSNAAGTATSNAATLAVTANQAPTGTIAITSGLTNGKFIAGQQIAYTGSASDPEDGTLGASAFTWKVEYISSIASGNPAVRPFVPEFGGQTGGTFTPATTGPYTLTDVAYRVTLTARDSGGLASTVTFDVDPNTAAITLASDPAGLTLTVDGQPVTAPHTFSSVVGFERPIGAAASQTVNGFPYSFRGWSDGGAATHTVRTPAAATTYTATYRFDLNVNFQPAASAVPAGYRADAGAAFAGRGNGFSYGWNGNNAATTRDRNASNSPDQRYDTLIHLQKPELPDAVWELAVPNGTYQVRLVAGDPQHIDSVYRTLVEGVLALDATPTTAARWVDRTVTATVADGRLTVRSATGARNNKLAFLEVRAVDAGPGNIRAGLAAEYRFDEGAGATTADASPGGNTGTLTPGATWTAGRSGGSAVQFDGAAGRVELASDLSGTLGRTGTVAFWLRTTQAGNDVMWQAPGVLGAESYGDGNDIFWGWLDAGGRIGVQAGDVAGAKSAAPVNDGAWHHVALTRDHVTGRVEVYVDGALSGTATSDTGAKTTPFRSVGRIDDSGGTPAYLAGSLDSLLVFDRVLSAAEVRTLV